MPFDDALVLEARDRGYLEFLSNGSRIRYLCNRRYEDNYHDPEEQVRAFLYSFLIIRKNYSPSRIRIEVQVPRRTPSDYADIVVFADDDCSQPYLVVEAKREECSERDWAQAIEQGFGNANSLRATLLLVDSFHNSILFNVNDFPPTERVANRRGSRDSIPPNYDQIARFAYHAGTDHDLETASPKELENLVRRAHSTIWAGGKRDPLLSFDEWSKLLFAKIYDERHTGNERAYRFQIGTGETDVEVGNRIRQLYDEANRNDRTIFNGSPITLPDNKIVQVIRIIHHIGFLKIDLDALGSAFEHFFGSIFRGELGQYFTRRELVRFVISMLKPRDNDIIIDPTAGSGGFLLEALLQVNRFIDEQYQGQIELERKKYDFCHNNLFGIEIHEILGRVCKTNLLIHKDGHTNIEADRSCLDKRFHNQVIRIDNPPFTIAVGNPPFGDAVKDGDPDLLGESTLDDFELSSGLNSIQSEIIIIERALQFLQPGGRLGMVVPDGLLNNHGEASHCPAFRRFLIRNCKILGIVSLPDFAFRKTGAQNKTSIIFLRKFTIDEKSQIDDILGREMPDGVDTETQWDILRSFYGSRDYNVFLAEASSIGYSPSGSFDPENDLYSLDDLMNINHDDINTILGQFHLFTSDPGSYEGIQRPECMSISLLDLLQSHPSGRLDPKYHLFKREEIPAPNGMTEYTIGELLAPRRERVVPANAPDDMFLTITLTQEGEILPREAGIGNNPPSWYGAYFKEGQYWYVIHEDDLLISRIDLWKGCACIVEATFDGGIVTNEFPIYRIRDSGILIPRYLSIMLRSRYFQRAIRAITTGHSNRRRIQPDDFSNLRVFIPDDIEVQRSIAQYLNRRYIKLNSLKEEITEVRNTIDRFIIGEITIDEMLRITQSEP